MRGFGSESAVAHSRADADADACADAFAHASADHTCTDLCTHASADHTCTDLCAHAGADHTCTDLCAHAGADHAGTDARAHAGADHAGTDACDHGARADGRPLRRLRRLRGCDTELTGPGHHRRPVRALRSEWAELVAVQGGWRVEQRAMPVRRQHRPVAHVGAHQCPGTDPSAPTPTPSAQPTPPPTAGPARVSILFLKSIFFKGR
jgi:hypothetical protein